MAAATIPEAPHCPQCGKKLTSTLLAQAMDQHRMVFSLTPGCGEHLSARTVGGSLVELDKLLQSVGRDSGVKTLPLIERIETLESGEMRFHLLIANARPRQEG